MCLGLKKNSLQNILIEYLLHTNRYPRYWRCSENSTAKSSAFLEFLVRKTETSYCTSVHSYKFMTVHEGEQRHCKKVSAEVDQDQGRRMIRGGR